MDERTRPFTEEEESQVTRAVEATKTPANAEQDIAALRAQLREAQEERDRLREEWRKELQGRRHWQGAWKDTLVERDAAILRGVQACEWVRDLTHASYSWRHEALLRREQIRAAEEELRAQRALAEELYVEDCHVSGMHDPAHTTRYICELQLRDLAVRVLMAAGHLPDNFYDLEGEELRAAANQVPRRINHEGWYTYYRETEQYHGKAEELERWESEGLTPTEAQEQSGQEGD